MIFTSHIFLFYFLPALLLLYYILPKGRNLLLVVFSFVFYGWWQPWFILLMLLVTMVNYLCGLSMVRWSRVKRYRRLALVISLISHLGLLGFFKYFVFLETNVNYLLGWLGGQGFQVVQIILPVGISFYIFKSISYAVDVYREPARATRSFIDYACYVSFFPQLLAGPIQRFSTIDEKSEHLPTFAEQLKQREYNLEKISTGMGLFILGFARKVLLADTVGEVADTVFRAEGPGVGAAWFGILAYTFQIYLDFAAYSDMAIGVGKMLGFECPRNFDGPYRALSFGDFWRRWHITLSSWFRDYLYIPLGGNRRALPRIYLNLLLVFLLCGLWHGANWTFLVWGIYHGAFLVLERWRGRKTLYHNLPRILQTAITFLLLLFSWVFFRADSITEAWQYFGAMFGAGETSSGSVLLRSVIFTRGYLTLMTVAGLVIFQPIQAFDWVKRITWIKVMVFVVLLATSLMTMFVQTFSPFLYFQF